MSYGETKHAAAGGGMEVALQSEDQQVLFPCMQVVLEVAILKVEDFYYNNRNQKFPWQSIFRIEFSEISMLTNVCP